MMTKKLFSMFLAILLSFSLLLHSAIFVAHANDIINADDTVTNIADIKGSFADNRVLVALTREASLRFETYSADDFAEIGCAKVMDLSSGCAALTKEALRQATLHLTTGNNNATYESLNKNKDAVSNFQQILCLELKNPGEKNVLEAIELLLQRDDVCFAEPDYELVLEDADYDDASSSVEPNVVGPIGLPNSWVYDNRYGGSSGCCIWNVCVRWASECIPSTCQFVRLKNNKAFLVQRRNWF